MKKQIESVKPSNNENKLAIKFSKSEIDLSSMDKIRGGDGEANGGGDIIITPPKLK